MKIKFIKNKYNKEMYVNLCFIMMIFSGDYFCLFGWLVEI